MMNKYDFTACTPQEWKDALFAKTTKRKKRFLKPVAMLAAVLAVLVGLTGTAFAGRVIRAPEYFGSVFLGDSPAAGEVYAPKNTVFESDRDDLQMTCTGIIGDKISLHLVFRIVSVGELRFEEDCMYLFETNDHRLLFAPSMGKSIGSKVLDERTLEMYVDMTGSAINFVGKKVGFCFENLEKRKYGDSFGEKQVISCTFEGEIVVDYANTVQKLGATDNTLTLKGIPLQPQEAEISNMNLCLSMRFADGEAPARQGDDFVDLVCGALTIGFADGSQQQYDLMHPPVDENDIFATEVGRKGDTLAFVLHLPQLIFATDVKWISINGIELFVR